jgi:hypothetical protein
VGGRPGGGSGTDKLSEVCEVDPEVSRESRADLRIEVEGTWEGNGEPWMPVGDGGEGRESAKEKGLSSGTPTIAD